MLTGERETGMKLGIEREWVPYASRLGVGQG